MSALPPSIAQRIEEAEALHLRGRLADSERLYQTVLDDEPANFDALHRIGVIRAKQGRYEEAVAALRAALERNPESAVAHYNLGIALAALKRRDDAMASYRRAIAIRPDFAQAHTNLGLLLEAGRHREDAIASYRRAIAIKPDLAEAYQNLGDALLKSRRSAEAEDVFRRWLEFEPGNETAKYLYALASGKEVVKRAPDAWIERLFDDFAVTFEPHMERLGYRSPRLVADAVARAGVPRGRLAALDAGCGTGLLGPMLRPYARHLTGVDLSQRMLEHAKGRDVYDALYHGELEAYMRSVPGALDLVASSDALVYFGVLESVLDAARIALRMGGLLVFTVQEALERSARIGYRLQPDGRYSHSLPYLRQAIAAAGFGALAIESATLRTESKKPVPGFVVTCERLARPGLRAPIAIHLRALRMSIRRVTRWIRHRA